MNLRTEWNTLSDNEIVNRFYSREETAKDVQENYDIRRFYSGEGYDIEINGVVERCLVQTSSNPLRELNDFRKIHCPITSDVKRGYYVKYEDSVWIIDTNIANIDGAYLSTRMSRCQYLLRWQNPSGNIVERWAYASDQTKYSNGEVGNKTLTVGENQYALLIAIDSETKKLKRGMRLPFDFDDAFEPDIYRLTNRKINLAEGTMLLTFSFDAFDKDRDSYIDFDNGKKAWICDYKELNTLHSPEENNTSLTCEIVFKGNPIIIAGGNAKTFTAIFYDADGNEVDDITPMWSIDTLPEFKKYVETEVLDDNRYKVKIKYAAEIIGSFFNINLSDGNGIESSQIFEIGGGV